MSWAVHDVEPYLIKQHVARLEAKLGFGISFAAILLGSWLPDMMTKWFIYGIGIGPWELGAENPATFHRSWPGVGFTHSLFYGVVLALLVLAILRNRPAAKPLAFGLMIGTWAHVLSDTLDSNGVMLFFPFSLARIHLDVWAYAGEAGRYLDGAAYFSSLGFAWDAFWILLVLLNWRTLQLGYFQARIMPEPFFQALHHRLHMPEAALVVVYRAAFFYGVTRWLGWLIWAHIANDNSFDLSPGGPGWAPPFETILVFFGASA